MDTLFLKIFNLSIIAGWITLAILILRPLLKKAPKAITVLLWALVAIRLLIPLSVESEISAIPSAETVPPEIVYVEEPQIHSGVAHFNHIVNPTIVETMAPKPEASVNPMQIVVTVASTVWVVGMIAMAVYALLSYLRIYLKVRASMPLQKGVRICDEIDSPFILGVFRPRIYLPSNLTEEQKNHVIAHEEAHLKRKDHWWKPLGFALLTVYWFHPLLWVAYIMLCRDIEMACDEKVIKHMETDEKTSYSEALLACSMPRRMIAACPLAFGEIGVKKRIKAILHYKKPAFWFTILAVVICVVCTGCLLTDPLKEKAEETETETEQVTLRNNYVYSKDLCIAVTVHSNIPEINLKYQDFTYRLENNQLQFIEGNQTVLAGDMVPLKLTQENFDDLFGYRYFWNVEESPQSLRESNGSAWKVSAEDTEGNPFVCYLLKQTNQAEPILVFFMYGSAHEIFQIKPATISHSSAEVLTNNFLNGNPDNIKSLQFTYYDEGEPKYNLSLNYDQTGCFVIQLPPDSMSHPLPLDLNYTWNGETIVATGVNNSSMSYTTITLTPYQNGFLYERDSYIHPILLSTPTFTSSDDYPPKGSFFALSSVEYKSN